MKHLSISILLIIYSVNFSAQVKFSPDTIKEIDLSELKEVTIKKGNEKTLCHNRELSGIPRR